MNLSEAIKDYISAFLRGAASRPGWPPALWLGPRFRPRAAKRRWLNCRYIGLQSHRQPSLVLPEASVQGKGQSFVNCSPRPRGQGDRHGLKWPLSPQRVLSRGTPEEVVGFFESNYTITTIFQLQTGLRGWKQGQNQRILTGFRESARGPPALWLGPLNAGEAWIKRWRGLSLSP